ncbi:MAG: alanine--tRNA ligase, partial [Anaerolineae bacterium]|nr:alanine--tRNA ligase [Anaerolineae bacterium]
MVRPISSQEIRKAFLDFFARNGHLLMSSSSLVPKGDPSLLFTSAGMVQFKPYFSGEKIPPHRRLASCQKCFRTTDIDRVGDESHLTFFEMLGNFSIGDYFKEGAIELAWEFVTHDLGLSPDRLWITIYLDDDEARDLWMKIGVPEARILRFGKGENWWGPAGETGPCGPDSEIFYDRGEKYGCGRPDCGPNCPYCDRYLELWNLVFMQYHQDEAGELTPLPQQNIDTGMGLERAAVVMQEASSVYETELFYPLVKRAAELLGVEYGSREASNRSLRIIAEHGRAATFLLSDGVMPANEGRGYVLRRILRKAIYHGRHLGQKEPFLGEIAGVVGDLMGEAYPELIDRAEFVVQVMTAEEERFHQTLDTGTHLLLALLEDPEVIERGGISGFDVFRLYDTYGLPPDFTREIAAERGIDIDEEGFEVAMAEQQERARAAQRFAITASQPAFIRGTPQTEFVGYDSLESTSSKVVEVLQEGNVVDVVEAGKNVEIVLDKSPFYAEAGGQVGDTGYLRGPNCCVRVLDTQWVQPEFFVHRGVVEEGHLKVGDEVVAEVDKGRRLDIMRNHTATHLLHKALREVLGGHASQSGSLVAPDRLRFDFTHMAALTPEELREIERRINARIRENLPVTAQVISYDEAIAAGAVAIFGEKYGDRVRMVSIDDYTKE